MAMRLIGSRAAGGLAAAALLLSCPSLSFAGAEASEPTVEPRVVKWLMAEAKKAKEVKEAKEVSSSSPLAGAKLTEKPTEKPTDAADASKSSRETPRRGRRSMSEDELDEAMELIEQLKPELAERLKSLRAEEPREAGRLIQQRFPRLRYLLRLKAADPQMYELRVEEVRLTYQSRELVERYEQARAEDDAELAGAVRDELSMLLEEQFELRQRIRRRELELLERRIAALRERIEARAGERQDVIERRLEELIGAGDHAER